MAILVSCAGCGKQFRAKDQFRNTKLKCPSCKSDVLVQGPHVCGTDVFISHSTADKQVADAVTAAMESKNLRCWIAPRDIPAGASWGSAIIEGIEDSRAMLLVFSQHANRSDQVLREVERAVAKRKPIVPLRIDREPMRKDFEYFLASCQCLDATDGALEDHLSTLTRRVRHLLLERAEADADVKDPAPTVSYASPSVLPPPAPPSRMLGRRIVVACVGLLLFLGVFGVWAFGPLFHSTPDEVIGNNEPARATQPAGKPGETDLLARVTLPDDVVSGVWTRTPDGGLHVAGPAPGRIRFGPPPPGDYDLYFTFTPLVGEQGVGVILTRFGKSFAFFTGQKEIPHHNFEQRRGRSRYPETGPLGNDVRHTAVIKVRKNSATATLDDRVVSEVKDFSELSIAMPWAIGRNSLGVATYRSAVIHAVKLVPVGDGAD